MTARDLRVTAPDGISLAVYADGDADRPAVLLVHGYPDNHAVWDAMAPLLAERFHVVRFDVRGTGMSDKPPGTAAYRMPRLLADIGTVLDEVSPQRPVHLVGHDWGSVQCWGAVADPALARRIASFTSISGPSLDLGGVWLRDVRSHPGPALRQTAHSYYMFLFQLPRLPEFVVRRGVLDRALPADVPRTDADKVNGLQLYRANVFGAVRRPQPRAIDLPVQVVVPERDPFITPAFALESPRPWVDRLTTHTLDAGHWVITEQPAAVVDLVTRFVDGNEAPAG